jgi:hypothetical protein
MEIKKVDVEKISSGLYILLAGFVFLWMTLGFIKWNMIFQLLRLWPLFFVIVGIDLILGKTRLSFLRLISPVIVIGVVIGLIYVSQDGNIFNPRIIERQKISHEVISKEKIADINIDFSSGNLKISDGENELINADINMPKGEKPILIFKNFEKEDLYEISDSSISNYVFSPWDGDHIWDFRVNREVPMKIKANTYVSNNEINLSKLSVSDFIFNDSFSSSRIILGENVKKIRINSTGSKINIEIPKNMGLKIKLEKILIMDNFEEMGLNRGFKEYTSYNYDNVEKKVDIDLNLKFSQFEIKFY